MRITLDGIHFRGDGGSALFAVEHGALRGWFEAPGVRRDETSRPLADGSFLAPSFRSGRSISWRGLIHSRSPFEQREAMEQLSGVCSGTGLSRLTVQAHGEATWADVHLAAEPSIEILHYGRIARYDLELWAPDPRRYGELRTFSGGSNVYHRGNAPAFPLIRISSGAATYNVVSPGGTFRVSGAPAGGEHVIDMRTGRLTRNGSPVLGAVVRAETWKLPPGPRWTHSITAGSGLSVEVHDTYF